MRWFSMIKNTKCGWSFVEESNGQNIYCLTKFCEKWKYIVNISILYCIGTQEILGREKIPMNRFDNDAEQWSNKVFCHFDEMNHFSVCSAWLQLTPCEIYFTVSFPISSISMEHTVIVAWQWISILYCIFEFLAPSTKEYCTIIDYEIAWANGMSWIVCVMNCK